MTSAFLPACGDDDAVPDSAMPDTAVPDTGVMRDTGISDGGIPDSGVMRDSGMMVDAALDFVVFVKNLVDTQTSDIAPPTTIDDKTFVDSENPGAFDNYFP